MNTISTENFSPYCSPAILPQEPFNIYKKENPGSTVTFFNDSERDFYKMILIRNGEGILSVSHKEIPIQGNVLLFISPKVECVWRPLLETQIVYYCSFNREFMDLSLKNHRLAPSPFLEIGNNQVLDVTEEQIFYLQAVFEHMHREVQSDYVKKYDVLRNYIEIILHETLKINPQPPTLKLSNSAERICASFHNLLEQQYKIDIPDHIITLRCPQDYADRLMIHVNHLNKTLKKALGKNTTALIADRTAIEAKSLLLSTHWDISQIAYCLGFEHLSNFNRFFKKYYHMPPCELRSRSFHHAK
ncbi:helix-turn-helix domain-containing protein [Chryseobacterium sp. Mn2064]|uniref:helix-turn-helix domain-containing protein n=1 Tax=Chryseobacterium sp. Mn2064 TaxID=3395263 RepID=UPI003BE033A6